MGDLDGLLESCIQLLDDESVTEEDKIDHVERLVTAEFAPDGLSSADIERLVLDILLYHRDRSRSVRVSGRKAVRAEKLLPSKFSGPMEPPVGDSAPKSPIVSALTVGEVRDEDDEYWEEEEPQAESMSPFDILRRILDDNLSDRDLQRALEQNKYDIQATLSSLMGRPEKPKQVAESDHAMSGGAEVLYSLGQEKVMCKYFVQYGECLRSDCFYSHDLSSRICRFWLKGACLAGAECVFLHEVPEEVMDQLQINEPPQPPQPVALTEDEFPSLGAAKGGKKKPQPKPQVKSQPQAQVKPVMKFVPGKVFRPASSLTPAIPVSPIPRAPETKSVSYSKPLVIINPPKCIPWESEIDLHRQYMVHRVSALRHGELRNKYLQLAAGSWHKNDAAAAKMLSKKGQGHNGKMIEEYTLGADLLYDARKDGDVFVDLHGMELEEGVDRLAEALEAARDENKARLRPIYAIYGSGHHSSYSQAGKRYAEDKMSRVIKEFLTSEGYLWKEFGSTTGKYGRIAGISPWPQRQTGA